MLLSDEACVPDVPAPAHDDAEAICDGLHDDGAPAHYLCSRCYPNFDPPLGGDLAEVEGCDESDEQEL